MCVRLIQPRAMHIQDFFQPGLGDHTANYLAGSAMKSSQLQPCLKIVQSASILYPTLGWSVLHVVILYMIIVAKSWSTAAEEGDVQYATLTLDDL
jgi:hypothetical protein